MFVGYIFFFVVNASGIPCQHSCMNITRNRRHEGFAGGFSFDVPHGDHGHPWCQPVIKWKRKRK